MIRIDVPGALATLPAGLNDRGQVVGGWAAAGATADPVAGEAVPFTASCGREGASRSSTSPAPPRRRPTTSTTAARSSATTRTRPGPRTASSSTAAASPRSTIRTPRTRRPGMGRGWLASTTAGGWWAATATTRERSARGSGRTASSRPSTRPEALLSEASDINNRGRIVGRYLDATPKLRSFQLDRRRLTRIDAPDRCDTAAFGLNDRGQIVIAAAGTTDGTTCPPPGGAG